MLFGFAAILRRKTEIRFLAVNLFQVSYTSIFRDAINRAFAGIIEKRCSQTRFLGVIRWSATLHFWIGGAEFIIR
jgi:hypothetical protein